MSAYDPKRTFRDDLRSLAFPSVLVLDLAHSRRRKRSVDVHVEACDEAETQAVSACRIAEVFSQPCSKGAGPNLVCVAKVDVYLVEENGVVLPHRRGVVNANTQISLPAPYFIRTPDNLSIVTIITLASTISTLSCTSPELSWDEADYVAATNSHHCDSLRRWALIITFTIMAQCSSISRSWG